jgi:hypothetical protein
MTMIMTSAPVWMGLVACSQLILAGVLGFCLLDTSGRLAAP